MSKIKIVWIEDTKDYITRLLKRKLKIILTDLGYNSLVDSDDYERHIKEDDIFKYKNGEDIIEFEHLGYVLAPDLGTLAKWTCDDFDESIFLVDYNLSNINDESLNGDEVIKTIRKHNPGATIVFYSSELTQEQMREKLGDTGNVICTIRDNFLEAFTDLF